MGTFRSPSWSHAPHKKWRDHPFLVSGHFACILRPFKEIHDAVMALPPDERRDRAKVNDSVRGGPPEAGKGSMIRCGPTPSMLTERRA